MNIKTSDFNSLKSFIEKLALPAKDSHKGQNGRVLIIGGSSLFHSAALWAAEIASHFVDMVHYSSTEENEKIFINLKSKFQNGIVVPKKHLLDYVREDDAVLIGNGMIRGQLKNYDLRITNFNELLRITNEAEYTFYLTKYLIDNFPEKKFIFDAGTLQMMKPEWLLKLKTKPILTPHQKEYNDLFGQKPVKEMAAKYQSIILLKVVDDIISDGRVEYNVCGGNAGLTKGGTGDLLAGLTLALASKNDSLEAAVTASILIKLAADELFKTKAYWYNIDDLIDKIPELLKLHALDNL
jgi:hydroxyethylthiazole kinase-like uncharacterized protein yjeF